MVTDKITVVFLKKWCKIQEKSGDKDIFIKKIKTLFKKMRNK